MIVETVAVFLFSFGVLEADDTPLAPNADELGVVLVMLTPAGPKEEDIFANKSFSNPCSASGAGSIPLRVNRSESDAKQRRAPSATYIHRI